MNKTINHQVFNGIRKTINRFREQPFLYFTESDIHASLSKDILSGNSDLFVIGKEIKDRSTVKTPISLVHHEYPTNFRYKGSLLKSLDFKIEEMDSTNNNVKGTDRGNYDLAILNPCFLENLFMHHPDNIMNAMKHIINKDNSLRIERGETKKEVLFAIEVKFIHPFNAGNKTMIKEVRKDINKLHLALKFSENFIKPINLIFCSTDYVQSNNYSIIEKIKEDLDLYSNTHQGVCTVFIESFFSKDNLKKTPNPQIKFSPIHPGEDWTTDLKKMLRQ
jgi:hypothetical protein